MFGANFKLQYNDSKLSSIVESIKKKTSLAGMRPQTPLNTIAEMLESKQRYASQRFNVSSSSQKSATPASRGTSRASQSRGSSSRNTQRPGPGAKMDRPGMDAMSSQTFAGRNAMQTAATDMASTSATMMGSSGWRAAGTVNASATTTRNVAVSSISATLTVTSRYPSVVVKTMGSQLKMSTSERSKAKSIISEWRKNILKGR